MSLDKSFVILICCTCSHPSPDLYIFVVLSLMLWIQEYIVQEYIQMETLDDIICMGFPMNVYTIYHTQHMQNSSKNSPTFVI